MTAIQMDSHEGVEKWKFCFEKHVNSLIEIKELIICSRRERVSKLYPLFSSIIEDSISLDLLLYHSRTNQSYIISRALLERVINFCYIQYATNDEFTSYIDYTKNKAARSLSRNLTLNGERKCSLNFINEKFSLPEEYQEAVNKFTSNKGKEIPRWTQVSIDNRANLLDSMTGQNLFIHIMMIYGDASEALHGTLYGSLFHLGVYNIGSVPSDQESLIKNTCAVKSFLYFMASSAIQTIFYCLSDKGIIEKHHHKQAKDLFMATSKETDLYPK
jgi:hypothetical protein